MEYECIKAFGGLGCNIGDVVEVVKTDDNKYLIDEVCLTDGDTVYEFFKKKSLNGWKYAPYSFSRMDCWKQCPKKFEYNYIIKPPSEYVASPILEKGKLFHAILEFDVANKLDEFHMPDSFEALSTKDAGEIIEQALLFSESSETYLWIKSLKGIKVPEQEMFLGNKLQPVETIEESLIRGFIDLMIYDEKTKSCYIFDWKTGGKSKFALKKWPKPKDQLELYAIWANQVFGAEYIEATFVYVEHDHMAKYTFDSDDIPKLKKKFQSKINSIESDNKFQKNLTQLCAWCDYKELCLGIDSKRNPREIKKEEIMAAGKGSPKENKRNHKNTSFLNKIRQRATT